MNAYELILRKREGKELTVEELEYMVLGFVDGRVRTRTVHLVQVYVIGL